MIVHFGIGDFNSVYILYDCAMSTLECDWPADCLKNNKHLIICKIVIVCKKIYLM